MFAASFCVTVHHLEESGSIFSTPSFLSAPIVTAAKKEEQKQGRENAVCCLNLVIGHSAKAGAVPMTAESPTEGSRSLWMAHVLVKDQHEKAVEMPSLKKCNWD